MVAIECAVCDNYMVHEEDAHELARLGYLLGEHIVRLAWRWVVARVVVYESHDGSLAPHRLPHDDANVHGCLGDAALAYPHALDEPKVLVHEYGVRLLHM